MTQQQREIQRRLCVLQYAEETGNVRKTCRYFGVARSTFYLWKKAYRERGEAGLVKRRPIAKRNPRATPQQLVDQILHLRRTYHMGPQRIVGTSSAITASGHRMRMYSPVVAHVSGVARLRAAVHPDVAFVHRRAERDPRLPHGGALYELTVSRVHTVLTAKTLDPLVRRLDRLHRRARRALVRGDMAAAEKVLATSVDEIGKTVGSLATRTAAHRELSKLLKSISEKRAQIEERLRSLGTVDTKTRWFARALGCDRVFAEQTYSQSNTHRLLEALRKCAVKGYARVARTPKHRLALEAAQRLIWWESDRRGTVRKRFKAPLKELDHPPTW